VRINLARTAETADIDAKRKAVPRERYSSLAALLIRAVIYAASSVARTVG